MGNFTDKDKGWNRMMTNFKVNSGETAGFVGYLRSSGDYNEEQAQVQHGKLSGGEKKAAPITMAQLASVHEFGSSNGDIPERSFMRSALDSNSKLLKRLVRKAVDQVIIGKMSKKQGIGLICQKMKDLFINEITNGTFTPLKPATIARKGSSKPLIDTGQLKSHIDWEIQEGKE